MEGQKEVAFLHNYKVEPIADHDSSVLHWSSCHQCNITIDAPKIVAEYSAHMGGVDSKDQDTADNSTSLWTTWYYLPIFFWILDSIIHAMYVIAKDYAENSHNDFGWNQYCSKNGGQKKIQIDLAVQLIDFGIRQDWPEPFDEHNMPPWIRQEYILSCDCKVFFLQKWHKNRYIPKCQQQNQQQQPVCEGKRDNIRKQPQECYVCRFHVRKEAPHESWQEARKKCKRSRKGCATCQIVVCYEHWADFSHKKGDYAT